ncbi:Mitochondrial K+-H+ exchange-related domain containing protein [Hyaloscypha variabilis]
MRLFLLPVSTRRTLIYCQRLNVTTTEQQSFLDKSTARAAKLWAGWEKKESGWQKKVVEYGNQALRRIPYEEWGLKSVPPLSARRKEKELSGKEKVEISFPSALIPEAEVSNVLTTLATERQGLHKRKMLYSFIGMPITAPVAIIPVIPNLPFFYLVFRAWSHWRALSGSKHLQFLVENKLVTAKPSKILDELYATGRRSSNGGSASISKNPSGTLEEEKMLLHKTDGKRISEALGIPELDVELDRAVWQVEKALKAAKELREEKEELDKVSIDAKEQKQGEKR